MLTQLFALSAIAVSVLGAVTLYEELCTCANDYTFYAYTRLPFDNNSMYLGNSPTKQVYAAEFMPINTQIYTRQRPKHSSCFLYTSARKITLATNSYSNVNCTTHSCSPPATLYALTSTQFSVGCMMCANFTRATCCVDAVLCDIYKSYDQIVPSIVAKLDTHCQWIYECTICGNSSDGLTITSFNLAAPRYFTYDYNWYPSYSGTMNYTNYTQSITNLTISSLQTSFYTGMSCN